MKTCRFLGSVEELRKNTDSSYASQVGVVLRALYDDGTSVVTLGPSIPRFHFFRPRHAMPAGDCGRPMADAHEERALLHLCDANGLRPFYTQSRARSAPCAKAA